MQKDTNTSTPLAAGVTGFVLGVAGAGAVALADENTRKKAIKKAKAVKAHVTKWSKQTVNDLSTQKKEAVKQIEKKLEEKKDDVGK